MLDLERRKSKNLKANMQRAKDEKQLFRIPLNKRKFIVLNNVHGIHQNVQVNV